MFTEARYAAVLVKRSDGSLGLKFHDLRLQFLTPLLLLLDLV